MKREELARIILDNTKKFMNEQDPSDPDFKENLMLTAELLDTVISVISPAQKDEPDEVELFDVKYTEDGCKKVEETGEKNKPKEQKEEVAPQTRYFQVIQRSDELNKVKEFAGITRSLGGSGPVTFIEFTDRTRCNKDLILTLDDKIDGDINKISERYQMVELTAKDETWYVEYREPGYPFCVNSYGYLMNSHHVEGEENNYDWFRTVDPAANPDKPLKYITLIAPHPNRYDMYDGGWRYKTLMNHNKHIDTPNWPSRLIDEKHHSSTLEFLDRDKEITIYTPVYDEEEEAAEQNTEPSEKQVDELLNGMHRMVAAQLGIDEYPPKKEEKSDEKEKTEEETDEKETSEEKISEENKETPEELENTNDKEDVAKETTTDESANDAANSFKPVLDGIDDTDVKKQDADETPESDE